MKSFIKIALFAIVATNAIRITEDPADKEKPTKGEGASAEEEAVGKFAYKMAGPDTKSRSEQISHDW